MMSRWAAEYFGLQVVSVMSRLVGLAFGCSGTGAATEMSLGRTTLVEVTS